MSVQFAISSTSAADQYELRLYVTSRFREITSREPKAVEVSIYPDEVFATIVLDDYSDSERNAAEVIGREVSNVDARRPITVMVRKPWAQATSARESE